PRVYMTPPTRDLAYLLCSDILKVSKKRGLDPPFLKEDLQRMLERTRTVGYRETFKAGPFEASLYNSNHIPGAACVHLQGERNSLLYSGDIHGAPMRLLPRYEKKFPDADALIVESTYFGNDHTPRFDLELEFIDSIIETVDQGGHVIVPAFAVGRTQELLLILSNFGHPAYVDGMGAEVGRILVEYPEYARTDDLERAMRNTIRVDPRRRREVLQEPSIIVTTSGMLEGGPALYYIDQLKDNPLTKIVLTGYQMAGSNGRRALEEGMMEIDGRTIRLKPRVEMYDFSAHAGDKELKEYVTDFVNRGTRKVFCVHGENCAGFAEWIRTELGVEAEAPERGQEYPI
ncbi:MAG: MBL fold metallo-hydrolase, partial [Euryarchaeota archaeon]|nr:MBL fold metallo-hydrolase [Euryarchaeota archaeon]